MEFKYPWTNRSNRRMKKIIQNGSRVVVLHVCWIVCPCPCMWRKRDASKHSGTHNAPSTAAASERAKETTPYDTLIDYLLNDNNDDSQHQRRSTQGLLSITSLCDWIRHTQMAALRLALNFLHHNFNPYKISQWKELICIFPEIQSKDKFKSENKWRILIRNEIF